MKKITLCKKHLWALIIVCVGIIVDQISKAIVAANMTYGKTVSIIPYLFDFRYTTNTGAAFGMLSDQRWIFLSVSTVAIIAMIIYAIYAFSDMNMLYVWGISLIVSGGIGNMIDRLTLGYVIDFIEFAFMDFATFNIADSCVCVGAFIVGLAILLDLINESKKTKKGEGNEDNGTA
ncbi:MAG: signal peptidase II [Clostridia bacterium]|nr:signal peptidase II [Clostridia bacterium]